MANQPSEIAKQTVASICGYFGHEWGRKAIEDCERLVDASILEASKPLVDATLAYCDKFEDNQFTLYRRRDAIAEIQSEVKKLKGDVNG